MSKQFYFAKISNLETQTFDNSLEHFHSAGIGGTIRENIQNSIDAKLQNIDQPVVVNIDITEIDKELLPGIHEIEEHIHSLIGGNEYTKETIEHMKKALTRNQVPVITFEDFNTKGLSGANQLGEKNTYNTFAYKKGVHFEEREDIEVTRGGSHGVGKIANNAASDIHLMYFANHDEYGNQHLGGTIQLIEHSLKGENFRSTGYFTGVNQEEQFVPYKNEGNYALFQKNSRGLKTIIPFYREENASLEEIIRSVCDNFFVAIIEERLIVNVIHNVRSISITKDKVKELVNDIRYYPENMTNIELIKKNFTPLYVDTYTTEAVRTIEIESNTEKYQFNLYFKHNEEIKAGRLGIVRSMGMKIVDHKVKGYVRRPFNAVLIGGPKEDNYLKSLENESHTELSASSLRDKFMKRDATKFLNNLNKTLGSIIEAEWEKLYPSEGKINTDDLLYEKKITFRSRLEERSEKIELTNGKKITKRKTRERREKPMNPSEDRIPNIEKRTRIPRKLKPTDENEAVLETIIAPTELVNRVSFPDKEIIYFNLKEVKEVIPTGKVNIGFRVVDGDGKEYDNEFDLQEAYESVQNIETGAQYEFDSYTINDVQVNNSMIKLRLNKKNQRSDSLKFVYKLEVLG